MLSFINFYILIEINKESVNKLKEKINTSSKILISTHLNADGDAIGTTLALAHLLKKEGKEVMVMTPNDFPEFLQWLPGQEYIAVYHRESKKIKAWSATADLLFAVDFNDPKRLKNAESIFTGSSAFKVLIDHHPFPVDFIDLSFSYTSLGSAAELMYYLIKELGYHHYVDKDIATCLYTGIMTDTGCFSFNSSYPGIFTTVSELLNFNIDKDYIYSRVYDNYSEERMRLTGYCLHEKMTVIQEYHTAYISLSSDELKRFNHSPGDTEGFVNLPFSIKGIIFTAIFIENKDYVKISFRSRGNFAVNEFSAKYFNGGGHINAAGGEWKESLLETIKRFTNLLPLFKDSLQ